MISNRSFNEISLENDTHVDGIDIALETKILKFGPLINEIYNRAEEKIECGRDLENCTSYTKNLKFYAYSSVCLTKYFFKKKMFAI